MTRLSNAERTQRVMTDVFRVLDRVEVIVKHQVDKLTRAYQKLRADEENNDPISFRIMIGYLIELMSLIENRKDNYDGYIQLYHNLEA